MTLTISVRQGAQQKLFKPQLKDVCDFAEWLSMHGWRHIIENDPAGRELSYWYRLNKPDKFGTEFLYRQWVNEQKS